MKAKGEIVTGDGFDKNVAEKMPRMRKMEEVQALNPEGQIQPQQEGREALQDGRPLEKPAETKVLIEPSVKETKAEGGDILRLIEDLHAQLLASGRIKRALEIDLASHQKAIHQLAQDNKDLRSQVDALKEEIEKSKAFHSESTYLKEENSDALEKIQEFQQELRVVNETLTRTIRDRDEALERISRLESQLEQNEVLQLKGRLKEREASYFFEENQDLQAKLEEALAQNTELEKRYETLKKSFHEVRESLTLLRDSCKKSYYNLSERSEDPV